LDTHAISESIGRIVADRDLRDTLVEAGQVNVKRFSWETAAQHVLAILEEAAA
jgi:glycosyltransferase involved in cell wall biosynthesis